MKRFAYAAIAAALLPASVTAQTVVKHPSTPRRADPRFGDGKAWSDDAVPQRSTAAQIDPAKKVLPAQLTIADFGDPKRQMISVLNKIKTILAGHGYAMSDVIKLTIFVAGDPRLGGKMDFVGMNEGFKQFFGTAENPGTVARSTIQVAALAAPAYLVEIEVTAAK